MLVLREDVLLDETVSVLFKDRDCTSVLVLVDVEATETDSVP